MTADLVQRIDAALEHPSSLSVSEVAKAAASKTGRAL